MGKRSQLNSKRIFKDKIGTFSKFRASKPSCIRQSKYVIETIHNKDVVPQDETSRSQEETTNFITFSLSELPDPPIIPLHLQELLDHLRSLQTIPKIYPPKKRIKRSTGVVSSVGKSKENTVNETLAKRAINGFMAFRAFYTQDIFAPDSQRELSTVLSKVWAENKELNESWSRYAAEYNIQRKLNPCLSFVSWFLIVKNGLTGERNDWSRSMTTHSMLASVLTAGQHEISIDSPFNRIVDVMRTDNDFNIFLSDTDENIDPNLKDNSYN